MRKDCGSRVPLEAGAKTGKIGKKLTGKTEKKSGDANARHRTVKSGSPDRLGNLGGKNEKYGQRRAEPGVAGNS